jgi:Raf kinase inhibitor-like YbhB/YbcL family protein
MMKDARLLLVGMTFLFVSAACSSGGLEQALHTAADTPGGTDMQVTSAAFEHEGLVPQRFTCDGSDVSLPLSIADVPAEAVSLALVMDDPDAPRGTWDHWVAFDIPVVTDIPEDVGSLGTGGKNSWGRVGYGGPCPPGGTHRYFTTVYALDAELGLAAGATKTEVLEAMAGHVLAEATLMGRYGR